MNIDQLKLFFAAGLWRVTGNLRAGRSLIRALGSEDDNVRIIAGMLLVRSRTRAVSIYREALAEGVASPLLLRVIGDSGVKELNVEIECFVNDADPKVASAARQALLALGG